MEQIAEYKNGTYTVHTFEDGTQFKHTKSGEYIADFPDSIDLKITNCCDMDCSWCYEDIRIDGEHADILNDPIIMSLHEGTEVVIGGGNPLTHPQLLPFLYGLKANKIIANMTVNQNHFMKDPALFETLTKQKLIYHLGISLTKPTKQFVEEVTKIPSASVHIVCGVVDPQTINRFANMGGGKIKVVFLGYKRKRRGNTYYTQNHDIGVKIDCNIQWLKQNLKSLAHQFKSVSFDNIAMQQLDVHNIMSENTYRTTFQGDDGQFTMFVDAVRHEYAINSTTEKRFTYNDRDTIDSIFKSVKRGNIVRESYHG